MNQQESISNPEKQALLNEEVLEIIEASKNLSLLYDIVASDDFDVVAAQSHRIRLGKDVNDSRNKSWAVIMLEQGDDGLTALFSTTYPRVKNYVIPENGNIRVSTPYSKERHVNFFDQLLLAKNLQRLEVA